jgi:hypothetical protein
MQPTYKLLPTSLQTVRSMAALHMLPSLFLVLLQELTLQIF